MNRSDYVKESDGSKKEMDLERIAMTTVGYGIVGSFLPNQEYTAPLMAGIGLASSAYDEAKNKGWNLARPALGVFVGGFIGSLFNVNANEYLPHVLTYSGAAVGGALGMYKSVFR